MLLELLRTVSAALLLRYCWYAALIEFHSSFVWVQALCSRPLHPAPPHLFPDPPRRWDTRWCVDVTSRSGPNFCLLRCCPLRPSPSMRCVQPLQDSVQSHEDVPIKTELARARLRSIIAKHRQGRTRWTAGRGKRPNLKLDGLIWDQLVAFCIRYDAECVPALYPSTILSPWALLAPLDCPFHQ